jgi:hypothetical protein
MTCQYGQSPRQEADGTMENQRVGDRDCHRYYCLRPGSNIAASPTNTVHSGNQALMVANTSGKSEKNLIVI